MITGCNLCEFNGKMSLHWLSSVKLQQLDYVDEGSFLAFDTV